MLLRHKNFILLFISYFCVLLNYPLIRASTTTYFLNHYAAKSTPLGWFISVLVLALLVAIMNTIQKRMGMHNLFLSFAIFSVCVFLGNYYLHQIGSGFGSYGLYVWKEVYIVLQVHLLLAYANTWFNREQFIKWIGLLGAFGSLGGVFGGLLTSYISENYGTDNVFYLGLVFVLVPGVTAYFTQRITVENKNHPSPLASLDNINLKKYVGIIIGIVFLSQFVINIADFQFNIIFEKSISDPTARTSYLGKISSLTNLFTLLIQILILPILFKKVPEKYIHVFIPCTYFFSILLGVSLGSELILVSSGLFLYLKSADYSLFGGVRELLYQPLKPEQKYGAKYLTDMLSYRTGKALISLVLIYLQNSQILTWLMLVFLVLWIILLTPLFKIQKSLR